MNGVMVHIHHPDNVPAVGLRQMSTQKGALVGLLREDGLEREKSGFVLHRLLAGEWLIGMVVDERFYVDDVVYHPELQLCLLRLCGRLHPQECGYVAVEIGGGVVKNEPYMTRLLKGAEKLWMRFLGTLSDGWWCITERGESLRTFRLNGEAIELGWKVRLPEGTIAHTVIEENGVPETIGIQMQKVWRIRISTSDEREVVLEAPPVWGALGYSAPFVFSRQGVYETVLYASMEELKPEWREVMLGKALAAAKMSGYGWQVRGMFKSRNGGVFVLVDDRLSGRSLSEANLALCYASDEEARLVRLLPYAEELTYYADVFCISRGNNGLLIYDPHRDAFREDIPLPLYVDPLSVLNGINGLKAPESWLRGGNRNAL